MMVKIPTQWENLRFFLSYQCNFIYWRYFMWNFAGRQNDVQGHGELEKGNWITGFDFIDNMRLGDQSKLPDDLKNNKGIEAGVYEETITEVSSIIGTTNTSLFVYTFIPETGVIGNYTITAYDSSDQVIKTQTITGVSVTANKHITYSGDFFSNDAPFSFTVNDTWDTEDRNL